MQYKKEKKLSELRNCYDTISIPSNIDEYIMRGIKQNPPSRRIGLRLRPLSIAAVIAFFLFLSLIRVSPVFADYLADVPVLKYIVKLVNYDKGLKSAVENNFIENIGAIDEHGDIKLTIDSIIVDQARMIVFYTIENNSSHQFLELRKVDITDKAGKPLEAGYSYNFFYDSLDQRRIQDHINLSFVENSVIPDRIHFAFELHHKDGPDSIHTVQLPYVWQFDIPIDKSRFENLNEVYDINQTVEIEGQKISFKKAILSPTRLELQVEFFEENSMQILGFDNLRILDEKGKALSTITNDINASMPDKNHRNMYFESNFFTKPQKLYIQGSSIRAIDKDNLDIIIDTEKKELIKSPDNHIALKDMVNTAEGIEVSFFLKTDKILDHKFSYFVFSHQAADAVDTLFDIGRAARNHSTDSAFNQEVLVTIPNNMNIKNPIRIPIEDYPARIKGDFLVRIK